MRLGLPEQLLHMRMLVNQIDNGQEKEIAVGSHHLFDIVPGLPHPVLAFFWLQDLSGKGSG